MRTHHLQRLRHLPVLSAVTLLLAMLGAMWVHTDLSHPEGAVAWNTYLITLHHPLYADWQTWPHRFMPYGPLLCAPLGAILSVFTSEYSFIFYAAGRMQSLLYLLLTCAVGATLLARPAQRSLLPASLILAFLALWPGIAMPAVSFRADAPALFWALAAFAALISPSPRPTFLAIPCFVISLAYKPALWAFIPTASIVLLIRSGFRPALSFLAATSLTVILYVASMEWLTGGLFLKNQVGASSMGLSATAYHIVADEWLAFNWLGNLSPTAYPLLIAATVLALCTIRHPSRPLWPLSVYFLCSLVLNHLSMAKSGAALNYLLECYTIAGLLLIAAVLPLLSPEKPTLRTAYILITISLLSIVSIFYNIQMISATLHGWKTPDNLRKLMNIDGTPLLGDISFTHKLPSAHALNDPLPYFQLLEAGKISPDLFIEKLATREYSSVVLSPAMRYLVNRGGKSDLIKHALEQHYTVAEETPAYQVWHPRP